MGITNSNQELSTNHIDCGDSFQVTLSLTAEPNIVSNPTDIVLILNRSKSMAGSPLANLKNGAKKFIDIIDEATDSTKDGQIGYGSRMGIVSFADTATQDTQLITSVADLKAAVDALTASAFTNHADAFTKALQLFDPSSPASAYVVITPDDEELEEVFADLAGNISKPGAKDIVIEDIVSSCFKITSVETPTKGSANLLSDTSLQWKIDERGAKKSEGASLTFTVLHVGPCSGTIAVNDKISVRHLYQFTLIVVKILWKSMPAIFS